MKKISAIIVLFALMGTPAFADGLRAQLEECCGASLSANVIGYYFSNSSGTATTDATKFVISTANQKGNKAYAGGSDLAAIYYKDVTGHSPLVSADIMNSRPTNFESDMATEVLSGYLPQ